MIVENQITTTEILSSTINPPNSNLNSTTVCRFPLGNIYCTPGALDALDTAHQNAGEFLQRHQRGEWGELCEDDKQANDLAVHEGARILSAYRTGKNERLWIITEADRTSTTVLLPAEY